MNLSIIITNFNYADFVESAIGSAHAQILNDDEIIVIDDGSTDGSEAKLKALKTHLNFILICQKNAGQMGALRRGIDAAKNDILVLLDSDDYFLPGYLDRLREFYQAHRDADISFCSFEVASNDRLDSSMTKKQTSRCTYSSEFIGPIKWATLYAREWAGSPTSGLSMRMPLAKTLSTLPSRLDPAFRVCADSVLVRCASLLQANKFFLAEPGFVYRHHKSNNFLNKRNPISEIWSRQKRTQHILRTCCEHFSLSKRPSLHELSREISTRGWPLSLSLRARLRTVYAGLSLVAAGTIADRASTVRLAFSKPRGRPGNSDI